MGVFFLRGDLQTGSCPFGFPLKHTKKGAPTTQTTDPYNQDQPCQCDCPEAEAHAAAAAGDTDALRVFDFKDMEATTAVAFGSSLQCFPRTVPVLSGAAFKLPMATPG